MARRRDSQLLALAAERAQSGVDRRWRLGAVGVRGDGVIVASRNSSAVGRTPLAHAEARLARKLTPGSVVYVVRIARGTGACAMARPCESCQTILRRAGVTRVVYTTATGKSETLCLVA